METTVTVTLEDERRAARAAMLGSPLERAQISYRALRTLLANPDDTRQVFLLGLATGRAAFPMLLTRICTADEGPRMLTERPSIDSKHVDYDALRALPEGTLGREYVRFLDANHLDPDLFQAPPGLPEIPAYIAQRLRQTHDIWHVLSGYTPDVSGEIALQAFTYGQTGALMSLLLAVTGSVRFGIKDPRIVGKAIRGFRRGTRAKFLAVVRFEDMWALSLPEVRERLGITSTSN